MLPVVETLCKKSSNPGMFNVSLWSVIPSKKKLLTCSFGTIIVNRNLWGRTNYAVDGAKLSCLLCKAVPNLADVDMQADRREIEASYSRSPTGPCDIRIRFVTIMANMIS